MSEIPHRDRPAATEPADTLEFCDCPECGLPAEVVAEAPAARLVGVRCVGRHWFFGLRETLVPGAG